MFKEYKSTKTFRYLFIFVAIIIAIVSVWITNVLVNELKEEERKKIELWAESVALISSEALSEYNNTTAFVKYDRFLTKIITGNTTIPVIVIDDSNNVIEKNNILSQREDNLSFIKQKIKTFGKKHPPIIINVDKDTVHYVYYDDSTVLKRLQLFPWVQIGVVCIFIMVSFLALNSTQKAEQNKVWVGLSKETAHQLGTPISSLMAWVEYLKTKDMDIHLLNEIDKDVQRLKIIAERFSKIGSSPEPEQMNLKTAVQSAIEYMEKRISSKVSIVLNIQEEPLIVLMNQSLFGWIIENLIKNAVDAMDGKGNIEIRVFRKANKVLLDISDTGKGILKSQFNAVFQPGYTTKKRGWGLGLSLVKRIIESYPKGKIYICKSELNKGTTFRIELKLI
ncbi:MAG: HAMP domain-containing histidine kinase [Dysgonamonadaceae bacterium]|jgi:nitrogen-specific signal transduction histidine kinase|nr:HAMP domain-containing histidine kinase [Dysgonamonadaceae bacterium]